MQRAHKHLGLGQYRDGKSRGGGGVGEGDEHPLPATENTDMCSCGHYCFAGFSHSTDYSFRLGEKIKQKLWQQLQSYWFKQ